MRASPSLSWHSVHRWARERHAQLFRWLPACLLLAPSFWFRSKTPDWPAFYAGAKLAATSRLYSFDASREITGSFMDPHGVWAFVRIPAYAVFLHPLGWLSPHNAFIAWQIVNLICVIAFAAVFRVKTPAIVALWPPLWVSFMQGQDTPVFLLAIGVAIALLRGGRTLAAGCVLSICCIKAHILLLVPVVVLLTRSWRFAAGVAGGVGVLAGVSFLAAGPLWPVQYVEYVLENQRHLNSPSVLRLIPSWWWPVAVVCAAVSAVIAASRKMTLPEALCLAIALSILVAPRLYLYDLTFALPYFCFMFGAAPELVSMGHATGTTSLNPGTSAIVSSSNPEDAQATPGDR